jgi:hypothetical protein
VSSTEPAPATPEPDADEAAAAAEQGTPRDDVNDALPLPNDPVDASGLLTPADLTGEAPD